MKNRLKKAMTTILVIQVVLFGLAIFGGNTIHDLSNEYLNILENRVSLRKEYLEEQMIEYKTNLLDLEEQVEIEVEGIDILNDKELIPELLEKMGNRIFFSLRQSKVTEMLIILEGENNQKQEGIYLRNVYPDITNDNTINILMERGSKDLAKKLEVPTNSSWLEKFDLVEGSENADFYYKPFQAAKDNPKKEISQLGYWSKPFSLSPNQTKIMTYSIPLRSEEGEVYGVMAVGLRIDCLLERLNYEELSENKQGAYLLGITKGDARSMEKIISNGPIYKEISSANISYEEKENYKTIYEIKNRKKRSGDFYASEHFFNIYDEDSPFKDSKWSLTGFIGRQELFKPINKIINSVLLSLAISLFIGYIITHIVGNWFMNPFNDLMKRLSKSNPANPFKFNATNVEEIDELSYAIRNLNNEILDYEFKLSNIINMMDVPIAAFEFVEKKEKSFCTNTLFEILSMKNKESGNYIETSYLREIIYDIKKYPETDFSNIYRYKKSNGQISWLRLIMREDGSKKLGIIEDLTDEVLLKRKIEYERDHDILTHLLNRRAFETIVKHKIQSGTLGHAAFVMWDLDNLKYVNDTYGHEYGDRYIQKAASILSELRTDNTIVARMSGDEFYTFIYGYKAKEEIREIIEKAKKNLYNSFLEVPAGNPIRIRASAGVAWYPDDSRNYDELIKYSDFAMYEVKSKDKGNIFEFSKEAYKKDSILLYGKEELNHFIDQKLVKYVFQPIVDARTGEIFGYEALMRPESENLKSPFDVMRLARSQSKLYEIEKLTFFQSMRSYKEQKKHFKDAKIFINSIPSYSLSRKDIKLFEEEFACHLDKLIIEVTEVERSNEFCTKIKQEMIAKWGGELALDDFGSGYNSELTLLMLSPKYVKIDMNIVRGIDVDLNRQKLLQNILSYSKNRNIKIIAEGVETKEEMDKLIEFDVDYIQGYYLGRPNLIPQKLDPKIKRQIRGKIN